MLSALPQSLLLERLRLATKKSHKDIDLLAGKRDYCSPEVYRRLLNANCAAILPLEGELAGAGAKNLLPDWDARTRSHALRADIADLGAEAPIEEFRPISGRGALIGSLYVLEGSRLGARFIAAKIQESHPSMPLRFLRHGEGQPFWPNFLKLLSATQLDEVEATEAQDAALETFTLFHRAFQKHYL